jgi:D-alanyl-D-alanine carboxypeptidase
MAGQTREEKLDEYIVATANTSINGTDVQHVREALQLIANGLWPTLEQALRLAALRRYLRFQKDNGSGSIHDKWAWTAREADQRLKEEPAKTLMANAATVQRTFAQNNKTYTLALSPLRSLAKQVELWNKNFGVQIAAAKLKTDMLAELEKPEYSSPPMKADIDRFAPILREANMVPEPGSAAPGLSAHGQMRAIDFVVMQGSKTIATTDTATSETVWRKQGWAGKLADEATSAGFEGPLKIPDEPWHWWMP